MRLRQVTHLVRGVGFPHEAQGSTSGDLPFFKVGDLALVGNERELTSCTNWVSWDQARSLGVRPVPAGSVLLPKIGAALFLRARRLTTMQSAFDNNVLAVVPERIEPRYLRYWLLTVDLGELANPGPVPSLNDDGLRDMVVPITEALCQKKIADVLDVETGQIDTLIERKRRMIDILEERRMAVFTEGVEGKLTSSDLAPTSLLWLSTRAAHWREAKLTLVARLGTGHTPSRSHPEWWEDCTIPWITTGEVAQMRSDRIESITETREMISTLGVANSSAEVHPAGTVVLCRTASAGYSAIMGREMATSQDFATWTCGPLLRPRFLLLCLRAMRQDLLGRLAMGSTHQTIYMPDIESIRVPLPPVSEQDAVVEAVWERLRPFDVGQDLLAKQIDLLHERRQALITAAVTGELDVGVAA